MENKSGQITPENPKPTLQRPKSILYLCNHNIIRSPMAEALTRAHFGSSIYTTSAGVKCGTPDPFVEVVMDEINIDLHDREPRAMADLDDTYFDAIITLSPTAHHVALEMTHVEATEVEYWPSADPTVVTGSREQRMEAYRNVRDRLLERILTQFSMDRG
ncbi:MAG: low molecular weight phosphatase family protein [Rhizobiaceae bacterium]